MATSTTDTKFFSKVVPNASRVTIQDVFDRNQYNLRDAATQSTKWLNQQAKLLGKQGYTGRRLLNGVHGDYSEYPEVGKMYMFMYDAKHKDTLPYWDKYPLVFPFRNLDDGFIGINLHYLPYQFRVMMLDKLVGIKLRSTSRHHKIQLSWNLINGVVGYKPLVGCVHRYLFTNLRTGLRNIDSGDWATAALLPMQQFVGATMGHVHKQGRKAGGY